MNFQTFLLRPGYPGWIGGPRLKWMKVGDNRSSAANPSKSRCSSRKAAATFYALLRCHFGNGVKILDLEVCT